VRIRSTAFKASPAARRRHDDHPGTGLTLHSGTTKPGRRRRKVVPVSQRRRTGRRLVALPPGRLADLLGAIPASLTLVLEPVLASPTTTRTPRPPKRRHDPVQHGPPTSLPPRPTLILTRHKHKEQKRWTRAAALPAATGATSWPLSFRASGTTPVMSGRRTPQLSSSFQPSLQLIRPPPILPRTDEVKGSNPLPPPTPSSEQRRSSPPVAG
jgi:hypothetical protein